MSYDQTNKQTPRQTSRHPDRKTDITTLYIDTNRYIYTDKTFSDMSVY